MNDPAKGICVENVTRVYELGRTRIEVLRGVSMNIHAGERISIMGASGAGKSSLLHTIGGLDAPDTGSVMLDGEDIYAAPSKRRNRIRALEFGFVFQAFHLLPELDVLENIALPAMSQRGSLARRQQILDRAADLLSSVGLGHRLAHKPMEMSGGEQQRAAIARALMNRPRYVFADEPTGNLDSATGHHVLETLFRLIDEQGAGLVIVTHNQEVAKRCARQFSLKDGTLVQHDI